MNEVFVAAIGHIEDLFSSYQLGQTNEVHMTDCKKTDYRIMFKLIDSYNVICH
jgi:hypothetical protein